MLIHKICEKKLFDNLKTEYSVIFEDDVKLNNDFNIQIYKLLSYLEYNNIDFDLIFLGNLCNNRGKSLIDNIYFLNENQYCFGTHGLLIKNKNCLKIYNKNCSIYGEIDNHYKTLGDLKLLNVFVIYPCLCFQNRTLNSTIAPRVTSVA